MIISAGGVVWKEAEIGPEIAVVHRPKYDDWSLPKGMLKKDESFEDAALRAVREETGLKVRISDFAGETAYEHDGINKIVMYWNMVLIEESSFKKSDKADKLEWLSLKDAFQKISYQEQKTLITNLYKYQKPLVFEKLGFIKSLSIAVRRLQSTIQSFKIEMNRKVEFQRREGNLDTTWVNAANS